MKRYFYVILFFFIIWNMLFAFLTLQNGTQTAIVGSGIAIKLKQLLGIKIDANILHQRLRLSAHIISFMGEGLILFYILKSMNQSVSRCAGLSSLISLVLAVLSEVVKLGIPGRHFSWSDCGLNVLGALMGISLAWFASAVWSIPIRKQNDL